MSQDLQNQNPSQSGTVKSSDDSPQPAVTHQSPVSKIIECKQPKKLKEVIEIDDSQENKPQLATSKQKITRKTTPPKKVSGHKKIKKMSLKCTICREVGKKSSMRICIQCRANFHVACLKMIGEHSSRYKCKKCRLKESKMVQQQQLTKNKIQQKKINIDLDKAALKKMEKEKKKQSNNRLMAIFKQRYPYYVIEDRIKFPIQDKLLFIYRQLFQYTDQQKIKPLTHPVIPKAYLGDLLIIENFFSTFREEIESFTSVVKDTRKTVIYMTMIGDGYDSTFCCFMNCLLKLYLSDIFEKNKTDNVKMLNEHPFFTLMNNINENDELEFEIIVRASQEFIRYLAVVPSMKKSFDRFQFPRKLNLENKIKIIVSMIKGLSEVDEFHQMVSIKSQKMQQLTKQKTELISQLKSDQAQNLSNNEILKTMATAEKDLEVQQQGVTRLGNKQLDKHKRKIMKLTSQQTKSEEVIKLIKGRINQISKSMPFLTTEIIFLGKDRNQSEYFFYLRDPTKLYVKFRNYLLDKNEDFYMIEGKDQISELIKFLSTKGIHEKHLIENILSLLKDDVLKTKQAEDLKQDYSEIKINESELRQISQVDIAEEIIATEESFYNYLTLKGLQWTAYSSRKKFLQNLSFLDSVQQFKETVKLLQESFLFVEVIPVNYHCQRKNKMVVDDSDEDNKFNEVQNIVVSRKKVPIRLWGINSEKTKKYWAQYLEQCIDLNGVWICAKILKVHVDKYVKKKMDAYQEQLEKQEKMNRNKLRDRVKHTRGRLRKDDSDRERSRENERSTRLERRKLRRRYEDSDEKDQEQQDQQQLEQYLEPEKQYQQHEEENGRPYLRERKPKCMRMNIDSDFSKQENSIYEIKSQSSASEDVCEVCGDFGDMICCDTCPKVYHLECLKIKQIPEGEWSCFKCLEKLSNQRQTRSNIKKLVKYS